MSNKKVARQNIRVAVRCRPLNTRERSIGDFNIVESCKDQRITLKDKSTSSRSYAFDRVFGPQSRQKDIYMEIVAPTVVEVLEGYGQTGTGKTFTMTGERSDPLRYTWETDPTAGIVPRALNQIFSTLDMMGCDFSVRVSFLELYNEELFDLLSSGEDCVRLAVYDDANKKGSVLVKGLREVAVHNKEEVYTILERGLLRRQTASTQLNAQSSRSHTVFTVTVHIKEVCPDDDEVFLKIGKLNLVDLAGSENIGRSGALDKRAREAGSINQSLLTLGRVITCLVDHSPHIPYRESKLTRLLQDSLGGKTKTSIIATIGPGSSSLEETISTLDYAHRAKNIQNRPEINQKLNKNQLIKGYNEELERLRRDLEAARSKNGIFVDADNYQAMTLQLTQQRARIDDLESRKETLESDLESAVKNFELSQQELSEIREAKESVDAELCRAAEELRSAIYRLEKTERRLREETYLRSEHQNTEEKLFGQAKDLLSVASVYEADLNGLQQKIDRFASLDLQNRSAIRTLPDIWLTENLKQPLDLVASLKVNISSELGKLAAELVKFRRQMKVSNENTLREVSQLSSTLATIVSANLKQLAEIVEDMVNDQVRAITDFRETAMNRALNTVNKLGAELKSKLNAIHQQLQAEAQARAEVFEDLTERAVAFSNSAAAWVRLHDIELEENRKMCAQLNERRKAEEAETRALVEVLQKALSCVSVLAEARMESYTKIDESLAAERDHIKLVADTEKELLTRTSNELIGSISSAKEALVASVANIAPDVDSCTVHLSSLSSSIQDAGTALDTLVEDTSQAANECMSSVGGIGKKLIDGSIQWQSLGSEIKPGCNVASTEFFIHTVDESKTRLNQNKIAARESLTKVDDAVSAVNDYIPEFDNISTALVPRLPALLSGHLAKTIHSYNPTGLTPLRKDVPYPKNLARTAQHSLLLAEFRQAHGFPSQESPLMDVTNMVECGSSSCFLLNPSSSSPTVDGEVENGYARKSSSRGSSGLGTLSPKSGRFQTSEDDLLTSVSGVATKKRHSADAQSGASSIKAGLT
ncbi:Kinesin-related motor protein Eg5 [Echinococcus granulosus]|uniref:Kinesin-related motor protein Eg5 n=2 Tax=Echinococcus granulosus TaxID=6210 RepID=W6UJF8_ECHGR|nr:Kinesin-related motor protein Eg5 [Echinococcus granulosus]EUB61650.1 Kinesin-related motor protein Eg5 [Echinococcus granulosus]